MQAHRAGFVATPTAELSNQEETLLGDILDWSLDTSCSGYEGDQEEESEGEKEGNCKCWEKGLGIFLFQCVFPLSVYKWSNLYIEGRVMHESLLH